MVVIRQAVYGSTIEPAPPPLRVTVSRYLCPGCHRTWSRRSSAVAHMERCWRLRANHACLTCRHFDNGRCCSGHECGCNGESDWTCVVGGPIQDGRAVLFCPLWEL